MSNSFLKRFTDQLLTQLSFKGASPALLSRLETQISKTVEDAIDRTLQNTLTNEDWAIFKAYLVKHGVDQQEKAMQAMIQNRPDIAEKLESSLYSTYEDLLLKGEAVKWVDAES